MDNSILEEIKQKALEEHIPILMDDTLNEMAKYLKKEKVSRLLEIGTAVRIFCDMLFKIFRRKRQNWYNRIRWRKSKTGNKQHNFIRPKW